MVITQTNIIQLLVSEALTKPDQEIIQTVAGRHLLGLTNNFNTGLCSILTGLSSYPYQPPEILSSIHNLAQNLKFQNTINASWGLAAINSLLNKNTHGSEVKIQDLLLNLGKDKNVAVIGHFPFVEKMGSQFKNFWVLEKNPGPN
ncbi:MAG: Rossmann-like domain-containing protein, partial [Desulfonatronovibrio sp.]